MKTETRERESLQVQTNQHGPTKETEKANESPLTLALETILQGQLLEITNPRRQVLVCVCVGELDPHRGSGEGISDTGETRVDGQ